MKCLTTLALIAFGALVAGCAGQVSEDADYTRKDRDAAYYDQFRIDSQACKARGGSIVVERRGRIPLQCMSRQCLPEPGDIYRCQLSN